VVVFVLNAPLQQSNIMVNGTWSSQVAKDIFEFVYGTTSLYYRCNTLRMNVMEYSNHFESLLHGN